MIHKRGQITFFVIISIVLIISVFLVYFVASKSLRKIDAENKDDILASSSVTSQESKAYETFVKSCLRNSFEDALINISMTGGQITPLDYYEIESVKIPFYYRYRRAFFLTEGEFEEQLAIATQTRFDYCISDFGEFSNYDILISEKELSIKLGGPTKISLKMPTTIDLGDDSFYLDTFETVHQFNSFGLYFSIQGFLEKQELDPVYIPIGTLAVLAHQEGFETSMFYAEDQIIVFSLIYTNFTEDKDLVFNFGVDYDI